MPRKHSKQLSVPAARPGHVRSTSTSSIPHNANPPQPESPIVSLPLLNYSGGSPVRPTGVPPNTSQGFSGMTTPANGSAGPIVPTASITTLLIGPSQKPFKLLTDILTTRSPYFRDLLGAPSSSSSSHRPAQSPATIPLPSPTLAPPPTSSESDATLSYPDLNEFSFALFNRWLYGAQLPGPADFYSTGHYLGLSLLASRFAIERLENEVMDLVRHYFRDADMTAPPFRLDELYEGTRAGNRMRDFLVRTAAWRAVREGETSNVLKDRIWKGGDLAVDFVDALVGLRAEGGAGDPRLGRDCDWHVHVETRPCSSGGEMAGRM